MLALPTSGFSRSAGTSPEIGHNIRLDILCDWIEGSVLFDDEAVSKIDLVEILIEGNIYNDSNLALNVVNEAWSELKRRFGCIKEGNPFSFIRQTIKSRYPWQENPAHSFCLLLSMPRCYKDWSTALFRNDYNAQGRLFESLTKASVENQFSDWEVYQTGWSRTNRVKLADIVDEISNRLGEMKGSKHYTATMHSDLGCFRVPYWESQCLGFK